MDKPSWMCLKKAQHYMKLSMATYGWLFVIYRHCCSGIFKLFPKFMCCSCFRSVHRIQMCDLELPIVKVYILYFFFFAYRPKPTIVKGDNCCLCNFAGVRYISKLQPKDILYASFRNHIFEVITLIIAASKST